jgi:preprotein translocase subunit YajC
MNLLTVFFQAPAAGPDGSLMWIMLIAMFVIMYFFMIRPQNKKQKEIANFRKSLLRQREEEYVSTAKKM